MRNVCSNAHIFQVDANGCVYCTIERLQRENNALTAALRFYAEGGEDGGERAGTALIPPDGVIADIRRRLNTTGGE